MANASAEKILTACKDNFAKWKKDCSGFLKHVAADLNITDLDCGDADAIVGYLTTAAAWVSVKTGSEARTFASTGYFVLAGLKSGDSADKFQLTEKFLTALQEDGVPKEITTKLRPLLKDKFLKQEQFTTKIGKVLLPDEVKQYQEKIVQHSTKAGEINVIKVQNGHVAIVVDGPLYRGIYPMVWCGSTGDAQSQGDQSVGEVWNTTDRDRVKYWRSKTAVP